MTGLAHQKVNAGHLKRNAYLYVRQSTLRQVFENTESTKRQYGLRQHAVALGWPVERIVVIDSDLGQSGASTVDRESFQKLVTEVSRAKPASCSVWRFPDWRGIPPIGADSWRSALLPTRSFSMKTACMIPGTCNDGLLLGLNRPDSQSTSCSTFLSIGLLRSFLRPQPGSLSISR